jgi:hypothetical protein
MHMGVWRYSSTMLDLDTRWRWAGNFCPGRFIPQGEIIIYVAGWALEPAWKLRRDISFTAGNRTRTIQSVAIPTELSRHPLFHSKDWLFLSSSVSFVDNLSKGKQLLSRYEPVWTTGVRFPAGPRDVHSVQTNFRAQSAYLMGKRVHVSLEAKRQEREADQAPWSRMELYLHSPIYLHDIHN